MLFKKIFSKKFRIHCFLIYFWNIMELPIGREWSGGISIHENKERYKDHCPHPAFLPVIG